MYKLWIRAIGILTFVYSINSFAYEGDVTESVYSGPSSPFVNRAISPSDELNAEKLTTKLNSKNVSKKKILKLSSSLSLPSELSKTSRGVQKIIKNPLVRKNHSAETQVYVELKLVNEDVLRELERNGLTIEIANLKLNKVQGWVSSERFEGLADIDNVLKITTPNYSNVRKGSVNSEGDTLLKTEELKQLGYTGKGVRIGIISDGANNWQEAALSGDLPDKVTTYGVCRTGNTDQSGGLCNNTSGTCNEGTAMAEIIHEIAPDAELAVAAVNTSLEFIQQVDVLINDFKADIIVDDLGFLGEPTFYDGDVATAVRTASKKVLFISAAGNSGYGHYITERYSFGQLIPVDDAPSGNTHVVTHDFSPDYTRDSYHGFVIPENSATTVIVNWDGRTTSWNKRTNFKLRIHNLQGQIVYASSDNEISSADEAVLGVCIPNSSNENEVYFATIEAIGGLSGLSAFRVFFLGGGAIEYPTPKSSVFGHPAVERVLAVGAINASKFASKELAFYSSRGPSLVNMLGNNIITDGVEVKYQDLVNKPDLVAVDGVGVTGIGGFPQRFFGTSAAAPHVAGIAAQLMSVSGLVKASDVRNALLTGAIDIDRAGFDYNSGFGLVSPIGAFNNLVFGTPLPAILLLLDDE